jgi:hypothetical protein
MEITDFARNFDELRAWMLQEYPMYAGGLEMSADCYWWEVTLCGKTVWSTQEGVNDPTTEELKRLTKKKIKQEKGIE